MKRLFLLIAAAPLLLAQAPRIPSSPSLGVEEARCRANEPGPAIVVVAEGLRDRRGRIRAEIYPPDDAGFLTDDNILVSSGRTFRRAEAAVPASGAAVLCLRVPAAGRYTMMVQHDRDANRRFSVFSDGVAFPGNPRLGRSRPPASAAVFTAGPGVTRIPVTMNYLSGLSMRPLNRPN